MWIFQWHFPCRNKHSKLISGAKNTSLYHLILWELSIFVKTGRCVTVTHPLHHKEATLPKHHSNWVQFSSVTRSCLFANPWIPAHQASLSITNFQSSLRITSIKSVMPSSHFILGRPLLLLPPVPPSIKVSSNESTLSMRWRKYWSFSFSIIPSKEIPGLISFRMD